MSAFGHKADIADFTASMREVTNFWRQKTSKDNSNRRYRVDHSPTAGVTLPYEQHRSIVWQLVMDLMRVRHESVLKDRPLGPDITLLFVLGSVAATANKGLPATASKIAFYLEMPRETVR